MKNFKLIYNENGKLQAPIEEDAFYVAQQENKAVAFTATFPAFLAGAVRAYLQFKGGGDVVDCGSINLNSNSVTVELEAKYLAFNFLKIGFEVITATEEVRFEPVNITVDEFVNVSGKGSAQGHTVTVNVGTVTELQTGEVPYVVNVGTDKDVILNFGLPGISSLGDTITDLGTVYAKNYEANTYDEFFTDITTTGLYKFRVVFQLEDAIQETYLFVGYDETYQQARLWQMVCAVSVGKPYWMYRVKHGDEGWTIFESLFAPLSDDGKIYTSYLPTIPINKGGTNATTAEEARANLGAASQTDLDNIVNNTTLISNSNGGFMAGSATSCRYGGAIGEFAQTTDGFAGGSSANSADGGAIGNLAGTVNGGAVGGGANSVDGGAVGYGATVFGGGSGGSGGGAVGAGTKTGDGFAGGRDAQTVNENGDGIDAVQLGTGTNPVAKSLQVYDHQLMDADGNVPFGRIQRSQVVTATSTNGRAYAATVDGVTELFAGLTLTIIPDIVSVNGAVTLNLNNLGAKTIMWQTNTYTNTTTTAYVSSWMKAGYPVTLMYNGTYWVCTNMQAVSASEIRTGTLSTARGGTGATTAAGARTNLGAVSQTDFDALVARVEALEAAAASENS